eukprot:4875347-Alexandrium_andersonii.AAC.1
MPPLLAVLLQRSSMRVSFRRLESCCGLQRARLARGCRCLVSCCHVCGLRFGCPPVADRTAGFGARCRPGAVAVLLIVFMSSGRDS